MYTSISLDKDDTIEARRNSAAPNLFSVVFSRAGVASVSVQLVLETRQAYALRDALTAALHTLPAPPPADQ